MPFQKLELMVVDGDTLRQPSKYTVRLLERITRKELCKNIILDEAIDYGAAIQAAIFE